ncbi:MAG: DUF3014 domain-containing protein [Gammaproteobacteria bacterium]
MDDNTTEFLKDWAWWIAGGAAVLVLLVLLIFVYRSGDEPDRAPEIRVPQVDIEPEPEETGPKHPLPPPDAGFVTPAEEAPPPLPPLEESDPSITSALGELIGADAVRRHVVKESIIPSIVVTLDNLPRDEVALRLRAINPVRGPFTPSLQEGEFEPGEEHYEIQQEDFERYEPLVKLVESLDTDELVAIYRRHYPLFQNAYVDLGYPQEYFNDRLVEVIDHLLETPEVEAPIELTRPHVLYEFADPELEELSAGQKALVRMGPENATVVKEKLREIRAAVSETTPPDAPFRTTPRLPGESRDPVE